VLEVGEDAAVVVERVGETVMSGEGDSDAGEELAHAEERLPGLCVVTGSVSMGRICFWSG